MFFSGLTVTQRVKSISQREGGIVPESLFVKVQYNDFKDVHIVKSALAPIQGMVVDYLTRFILSGDVKHSFDISIKGAQVVDRVMENSNEFDKLMLILSEIKGLDRNSIFHACKAVCYDSAYRKGYKYFQAPEDLEVDDELINNVRVLVERSLAFLELVKPVVCDGFTFDGGYTDLVVKGDGDYLTKDILIDFKTSKDEFSPHWSLQVLIYYLLGIHSIHPEFQTITKLCIFNPFTNCSYICDIDSISDEVKYMVSHYVIGYKMTSVNFSSWKNVNGTDEKVLRRFVTLNFKRTDFQVEHYNDGIFDITLDDYWTFLSTNLEEFKNSLRPLFPNTNYVKLVKNNGYFMFVSVSPKEKYSIMHGGRLHRMKYSLEYYYDNIERYAKAVTSHFSKYWDALRDISALIQSLEPTEKYLRTKYSEYLRLQRAFLGNRETDTLSYDEWYEEKGRELKLTGRCHGCIVDVDYSNHIYVNPYDGKVTAYNASSMYDKNVYRNTRSLIAAQRPEMLPSFDEKTASGNVPLLISNNKNTQKKSLVPVDDVISKDFVKVYEYDMYEISNKLKPLQYVYDLKLIQIWYDEILGENKMLLEEKYKLKSDRAQMQAKKYMGQSKIQLNGFVATITAYRSFVDMDVQFEDGYVMCNTTLSTWRAGRVIHPNVRKTYEEDRVKNAKKTTSKKDKYIGLKKLMKCGLYATVIDYKDCKNLTIQFEDGYVKSGVRSDHFTEGKVGRY